MKNDNDVKITITVEDPETNEKVSKKIFLRSNFFKHFKINISLFLKYLSREIDLFLDKIKRGKYD
jgi:hypothetical protein